MSRAADGNIDQLVKARWLAIGLSQSDLAEVLGAALQQTPKGRNGSNGVVATRLTQIADALGISLGVSHVQPAETGPEATDLLSDDRFDSTQSLLQLRLLRAFCELHDDRTRRMLVHLAEQIVKRQANRHGDAG
jgi:transcriptional regulator with XRE-family HTH domain